MSSGITFNSLRDAKEYQQRMVQTKQIASKIRKEGNKYIVTLLEHKPVKIFDISQEEMERYVGEGVTGFHRKAEGEHGVWFTEKTSTKAKLHELGHAQHEHGDIGGVTFADKIGRELDAEIYAWQAMGKELTPRVAFNAVRQAYIWKPRMDWVSIINAVARKLEERGIHVSREDKQDLFDITLGKTDDPELEEWKESLKEEF